MLISKPGIPTYGYSCHDLISPCRSCFPGDHMISSFPVVGDHVRSKRAGLVDQNVAWLSGRTLRYHPACKPLPPLPARTYEALPMFVLACTASPCLVAGKHFLFVPPGHRPRPPPPGKVVANVAIRVYIHTSTYDIPCIFVQISWAVRVIVHGNIYLFSFLKTTMPLIMNTLFVIICLERKSSYDVLLSLYSNPCCFSGALEGAHRLSALSGRCAPPSRQWDAELLFIYFGCVCAFSLYDLILNFVWVWSLYLWVKHVLRMVIVLVFS
jgi:hypothetical protein